ncbi:MAG: HAD family hydrolase [Planctomycetota bacterium]
MSPPWRAVTFDCFGTLIDWRSGMERVLRQFPSLRGREEDLAAVLAAREVLEQEAQAGSFRNYAEILSDSLAGACRKVLGVELTEAEKRAFAAGQPGWPAFPEAPEALGRLAAAIPVGLLSNCDAGTLRLCAEKHLAAPIHLFVSSEDVRSYKPAAAHWLRALEILDARPEEVLHVSFSPFYDLLPARALGFALGFLPRYGTPQPAGFSFAAAGATLDELTDAVLTG